TARASVLEFALQPLEPLTDRRSSTCCGMKHRRVSTELTERRSGPLGAKIIQQIEKIRFAQDHEITGPKDDGILGGFVVALCHAEQRDVAMLTKIKTRGTHEVPDVLDKQQVDARERMSMQRPVDQVGIEVAGGSCRDLHCRYAVCADARRIVVG